MRAPAQASVQSRLVTFMGAQINTGRAREVRPKPLPDLAWMPYPAAMGAPRDRLRRLAAAFAWAFALLVAALARAQPAALHEVPLLVQRAPAASDCPDATALAERVNELVGRKALVAMGTPGQSFAFEIQFYKADEGYTAIMLAAGRSRQLEDPGPTCAGLSDALALTLAILVDADEAPPAPPPPPPPAKKAAPAPTFVPPPLPPPAPTEGPRLLGSPLVGVSTGLSGDAVPAAILAFDLRVFGPLSIALGFAWMPSQDFALAPGHVEVQLLHGQLAGCLSSWRVLGRVRLGACLQLDVGAIRGKGVGYDTTGEVTRPWTALGLLGLLDVPVAGPFYWSSRLSALVVTQQEGFRIDRVGVAFDPAPVGLLVATGVGVRFF